MEMPILSGDVCARCGDLKPGNCDGDVCRVCRLAPPPFERAVAYALYEGRMREAIHALKYDRMHAAAKRLGRMLALAMLKIAENGPAEMVVIPVPLYRSKRKQRGFNQALALAEYAVAELRRTNPEWRLALAPKVLKRVRATDTQAGLSPRQRRLNMRGAFEVSNSEAVRGRDVLLVDDILTTGATARSASLALRRAGARSVWVATLARAERLFAPAAGGWTSGLVQNGKGTEGDRVRGSSGVGEPTGTPAAAGSGGTQRAGTHRASLDRFETSF